MALTPGSRLGPYEVTSLIGAGGMGEVYRARDTKLDRDVALKILPESRLIPSLVRVKREPLTSRLDLQLGIGCHVRGEDLDGNDHAPTKLRLRRR